MGAIEGFARREVTADEVAAFDRDGFVVLRGILDPAVVLGMADPVDRALGAPEIGRAHV